jgi:hypothetical protein
MLIKWVEGRSMTGSTYEGLQIWFLTGSQALYGDEVLEQVADQSQVIAETLRSSGDIPVELDTPRRTGRSRGPRSTWTS